MLTQLFRGRNLSCIWFVMNLIIDLSLFFILLEVWLFRLNNVLAQILSLL